MTRRGTDEGPRRPRAHASGATETRRGAPHGCSFDWFARAVLDATFAFLGPITLVSYAGDRPIAITWRWRTAMRRGSYARYATLRTE